MTLSGKVVAVTGGSGQLGGAVVAAALAAGARVASLDHAASARTQETPNGALALGGFDLAEPEAAVRALDQVVEQFGALDALVNVAGTFRFEKLADGSLETWDLLYRANLRTAVSASRAAVPHLLRRGGGRIVNVGALAAANRAGTGMGAYTASKAGVLKLTEALAAELKDHGITVNAVLPSTIDTPANRADMPKADFGRWVAPRDLASVIVFLLSDEARAVTGALIPVSGRV
jgi:NAD(P)-dependent dehydrogenase (short-subunit alcohol dehydrogenase family)